MTYRGSVDPKALKEIADSLNVFDRVSKKFANKMHQNPMLVEAMNTRHVQVPQNYIQETHTQSGNMLSETATNYNPTNVPPSFGVQVGSFAVFPVPNASGKNRYSVVNMTSQQKIVENLFLAESADTIVKILNGGVSFYSPQVKQILEYEQKYSKHYNDAVTFKRKSSSDKANQVLETRFEESKRSALLIRENLRNYCKKII